MTRHRSLLALALLAGLALQSPARAATAPAAGVRLLAVARGLLEKTRDDRYTHHMRIDPARGAFHADCSELIDYLVTQVAPQALGELPLDAGHPRPRAQDYAFYFRRCPPWPAPGADWGRVPGPAALRPGDVVAFANPYDGPAIKDTGHVMLVAGAPRAVHLVGRLTGFDVPVIDSTAHGHGPADPRHAGKTGLGEGVVFIPVNAAGKACGFAWSPTSRPKAVLLPVFGRLTAKTSP